MSTMTKPQYMPPELDRHEYVEDYSPRGFHPISIGDVFEQGRYKVIHKLGFGGSSTVWLARDQQKDPGTLITLRALRADTSTKDASEMPELTVPKTLLPLSSNHQTVLDHFVVRGPNGAHRFIVSPLAGPSILTMSDSPGRISGSRRLRADLARRVAKQTATMLLHMHRAGLIHGDFTTSNILFRVADHVLDWTDVEVYAHLGVPLTDAVVTRDGQPLGPHVPAELVEPIADARFQDASLLQEDIVIIDFGQSYAVAAPPPDYKPATTINYLSPEARFEGRAGREADVWALGCALFEIRAGYPLFEPFFSSDIDILRQTVETLGRLPDPWWGTFDSRALWFEEDGEPKSDEAQMAAGLRLRAFKSSIRTKLRGIGVDDDPPEGDDGPIVEKSGVRLGEEEVALLGDLLERMLRYRPEERITMEDVVAHPWFSS